MGILRIILTVIFVLVAIALTVIVLLQEGKSAGLGTIAGSNSYWEQNKGRSAEGKKVFWTRVLAIAFIVLAVILNLNVF
ncbi:MAG: preprotein translocase subunit SecG [Lachnospiraceae bacterium]|nr:preprotein translocase subunit SecG [Lachnospiraceae bacterium]